MTETTLPDIVSTLEDEIKLINGRIAVLEDRRGRLEAVIADYSQPAEPEQPATPGRNAQYDWELGQSLWEQGLTARQIAEAIGAPWQSVRTRIRRDNWPKKRQETKPKPERKGPLPTSTTHRGTFDWELGRKLWDQGKRALEIAKALGCTEAAVYWQARYHDWPKRNQPIDAEHRSRKAKIPLSKRERIPVQQCPHCGHLTNVDPCERCHIYIPGAKNASRSRTAT